MLVIAHIPSTIKFTDVIMVLEHVVIVDVNCKINHYSFPICAQLLYLAMICFFFFCFFTISN